MEKVYFDQGRRKCLPFFYDGCGPVVPFDEMNECQALCETDVTPRLADFRRVKDRPFALVDVEYPADWWDDPTFVARINGQEVPSRWVGSASSPQIRKATLEVFLGAEPIKELAIETVVDGQTYRVFTPLFWEVSPLLLLLDHTGHDEALLEPGELRFVSFRTGTPTVRLNGREIVPEVVTGSTKMATLWRVAPQWAAGRNAVTVEAVTSDGKRFQQEYSFINLADGHLAYRQKAYLTYGVPGSRSGPFYDIQTRGDAIALGAGTTVDVDVLDESGWLNRAPRLVLEIVGAAPGEATLEIYEQSHFRDSDQVKREIHLRVSK